MASFGAPRKKKKMKIFWIVLLSWKTAALVLSQKLGNPDSLSTAHVKTTFTLMQAGAETIDLGPLEKAVVHSPLTPTKVPGVHTGKGSGPQVQPSSRLGSPRQVFWSMGVAFCISRGDQAAKNQFSLRKSNVLLQYTCKPTELNFPKLQISIHYISYHKPEGQEKRCPPTVLIAVILY